jgi:hypothetical protein
LYNTVFLAILLTTIYYIINNKKFLFTYFTQGYNVAILIGTIAIAFVIFIITLYHNTSVVCNVQKRMWVVLQMVWAMIYALPLLIEGKESTAFEEICLVICYTFALQGLIHLTGYLYEPLGEYLYEMKPEGIKEKVLDPKFNVDKFRLYCLSGIVFVELVAAYGVAFMLFFRLQLVDSNYRYFNGWKKYVILFFMIAGTSLAGRTGFVGLGLGLLLWFIFSFSRIFVFIKQNFWGLTGVSLIVVLAYSFLLSPNQRQMFNDEVFPFAFEWYYNYMDYGTFSVTSLDAMEQQYYYLHDETLIQGHGATFDIVTMYSPTDAGYMNNLIFGGIPYLLSLIIYQSMYFIYPILIAGRKKYFSNRVDAVLFLLFFFYIFLLNYKTTTIGTLHIVESLLVVAGSTYIIQSFLQNKQNELVE